MKVICFLRKSREGPKPADLIQILFLVKNRQLIVKVDVYKRPTAPKFPAGVAYAVARIF